MKAFETLIESRAVNPAEKLHFLGKYVAGEAKSVVEGFMLLDGDDAYEKAKRQLSKRFGNSFAVASAFRKRLDEWPQVPPNDGHGLRKFADLLVQCEKAMQRISSLKVLDDDQENLKMVSKLPRWAAVRWGRLVYNWREENDSFPPFSQFVKFIVKEADIACDPVNLRKINKEEDNKRPKNVGGGGGTPGGKFPVRHDRNPRNTMATKSEEDDPNDANRPKNENNSAQLREMMELDFSEKGAEQPMSQDDKKFLSILEKDIRQREDGHYEIPLPFREETPVLPNNKALALHRLQKLQTRLENNKKYCEDYINFMNELIERNYAERVPENELAKEDGKVWYIPHHGVYHPRKPEKIRVVFDCGATYQ